MAQILNSLSDHFRTATPVRGPSFAAPAQIASFCHSSGSPLDPTLASLAAHGARISVFPLRQLPLDWFDRYANSFDIALIDADFLGDKVEMIDFGMRMRRFAPELPLVMLSSQIATSDRTTERMAFCDVTLRLPVQETELMESFSIALENHAYWRDSRYEARLLQPRKPRTPRAPGAEPGADSGAEDDARHDPPSD